MPTAQHIANLLYRELEGKLSGAESTELQAWKTENPEHTKFFDEVLDEDKLTALIKLHHPENKETVKQSILTKMEDRLEFKVIPFYKRSFFRVAVAACIALLITVGGYFMFFNRQDEKPPVAKNIDIKAPETNKAVITLPDGKLIALDTLTTYTQGSVTVTKTADGRLVYTGFGSEVKFNTLTNPMGSKVLDMTLADGSHIWLNAGSSITYPVAFAGNERKVTMAGEAYLEVAHNSSMPFTVTKGTTTVQVLGTKFNVNAYDDEADIKVTLLEGSVRVNTTNSSALLKPGQQASIADEIKVLSGVNVDAVMAWKNGLFSFNRADIKTIMRQLARWYDLEVSYEGEVSKREFGGEMQRDLPLSSMIRLLEKGKFHFRQDGRKLIVLP